MSLELVREFKAAWPAREHELERRTLLVRPRIIRLLVLLEAAGVEHARVDTQLWYAAECPACRDSSLCIADGLAMVILACWNRCARDAILEALEGPAEARA